MRDCASSLTLLLKEMEIGIPEDLPEELTEVMLHLGRLDWSKFAWIVGGATVVVQRYRKRM